jgi:hypothetical protein
MFSLSRSPCNRGTGLTLGGAPLGEGNAGLTLGLTLPVLFLLGISPRDGDTGVTLGGAPLREGNAGLSLDRFSTASFSPGVSLRDLGSRLSLFGLFYEQFASEVSSTERFRLALSASLVECRVVESWATTGFARLFRPAPLTASINKLIRYAKHQQCSGYTFCAVV